MLEQAWEVYATNLANAETEEALVEAIQNIISEAKIDVSKPSQVVYGSDTRPSGPALVKALEDGLSSSGSKLMDAGLKTTPQLHYLVKCYNTQGTPESYGEPTEEGYYQKLSDAFKKLMQGKSLSKTNPLLVDCANGVGAPKLQALTKYLGDVLPVKIINDTINVKGKLNYQCGADFVKTGQRAPLGMQIGQGDRCASYDGDADRIVYYYVDESGTFKLLDGDKIAGLAALFIIELVKAAGVDIAVGVVQTAYANGSSTSYLKNVVKIPVACVPTGVKHLHHAAERYDVGVYFEANGHGTVLFSPSAQEKIKTTKAHSPAQQTALEQLLALTDLINQTVGDAISDMLMVETILAHRQWRPKEWDQAYTDLPNRLVKVVVSDRSAFKTEDAERKLVQPEGLQAQLDELVAKFNKGRSFVRPSGTEDVVRVYAEAATKSECDNLAYKVGGLVFDKAGGAGQRPREFL